MSDVPWPQWENGAEIFRLLEENRDLLNENQEALFEVRGLLGKPWRWFRLRRVLNRCDARLDRVEHNLAKIRMLRGE